MRVAIAYVLAFFLSPTIASVVRWAALLMGINPSSIGVRFSISVIEGGVAMGVSAVIFRLLGLSLGIEMAVVLLVAYFLNDLRRLRRGPAMLAQLRTADLLGDFAGIAGAAFILLA